MLLTRLVIRESGFVVDLMKKALIVAVAAVALAGVVLLPRHVPQLSVRRGRCAGWWSQGAAGAEVAPAASRVAAAAVPRWWWRARSDDR